MAGLNGRGGDRRPEAARVCCGVSLQPGCRKPQAGTHRTGWLIAGQAAAHGAYNGTAATCPSKCTHRLEVVGKYVESAACQVAHRLQITPAQE